MQKETMKTFCGVKKSHQRWAAMAKELEAIVWSGTDVSLWFPALP